MQYNLRCLKALRNQIEGMIRYFASGYRNYSTFPDPMSKRLNWEFFIVTEGKCTRIKAGHDHETVARENTLWVIAPHQEYHWTGGNTPCYRTVFHFAYVPDIVRQYVGEDGKIVKKLTKDEATRIQALAESIRQIYFNPTEMLQLHSMRVLAELSIIALSDFNFNKQVRLDDIELTRVQKAEAWFRENLKKRPTIDQIADQVGVSSSQMRRYFKKIYGRSPLDTFKKIRLYESMRMLSDTDWTIDQIARESGFASTVDFHRSFKSEVDTTPHKWRRQILTDATLAPKYPGVQEEQIQQISSQYK